jgi:hypothetical protein
MYGIFLGLAISTGSTAFNIYFTPSVSKKTKKIIWLLRYIVPSLAGVAPLVVFFLSCFDMSLTWKFLFPLCIISFTMAFVNKPNKRIP